MSEIAWFQDPDWTLVRIHGEDRKDFLHRLTTNVLPNDESPLLHNFFLSVNARILAEFWVSAQEDHLALLTPTCQVESLKECIDRFHFGEKIEVAPSEGSLFVVKGADLDSLSPHAQVIFSPDPRYGDDCYWCEVSDADAFTSVLASLGAEMDPLERERRRIALGRPKQGVDYDEKTLFVEVAQQDDFSEDKGCYPGQEIVARVLHRGRLNRHLRGFVSSVEIPEGWTMMVNKKEVASVRSRVSTSDGGSTGYLLVRREYGETGQELTGEVDGVEYTLTVTERTGEVLTGDEE